MSGGGGGGTTSTNTIQSAEPPSWALPSLQAYGTMLQNYITPPALQPPPAPVAPAAVPYQWQSTAYPGSTIYNPSNPAITYNPAVGADYGFGTTSPEQYAAMYGGGIYPVTIANLANAATQAGQATNPTATTGPVYRPPTPYYPGQTVAGFTPAQIEGQNLALQAAGNIQNLIPSYLNTIQATQPTFERLMSGEINPYASVMNQFTAGNNPYMGTLANFATPQENPWAAALAPYANASNPYTNVLGGMSQMQVNPYAQAVSTIGANATYNPYAPVMASMAGGGTNPYAGVFEQMMNPAISPVAYTPAMMGILSGGINPYATQMGNTIAGQLGTQFSENVLPYIRNEAISAGTYGGSRQALSEGMAAGRFGEALAGQLGNLYGGMWESAQNRALQAALGVGNLYETAQGRALQAATQGAGFYETEQDRALRAAMEGAGLYQQGQQLALSAALGGGQMYSTEANRALQAASAAGQTYQSSQDAAIRALLGGGEMYQSGQELALRAATETAGLYETEMDRALKAAVAGGEMYETAQDRALKAALGMTTTYPAAISSAMEAMALPSTLYAQVGTQQQAMQQQQINEAMQRYYYDPYVEQLKTIGGLLPGTGYGTTFSESQIPTFAPSTSERALAGGLTGYGLYASGLANWPWAAALGLYTAFGS